MNSTLDTIIIIAIVVLAMIFWITDSRKANNLLKGFVNGQRELTPAEFLSLNKKTLLNQGAQTRLLKKYDCEGVYVLHNKTKGTNYVGKSNRLIPVLNMVLSGSYRTEAFDDFANGDQFTISIVKLEGSGFLNTTDLAADILSRYENSLDDSPEA